MKRGVQGVVVCACMLSLSVPAPGASAPTIGALAEAGAVTTPSVTAAPEPADRLPAATLTRVYVGMWTSHVREPQRGLDANSLVGVAYRGFYGATFMNSYGDRAFAAGVQRSTTSSPRAALKTAIGYRAGLVTGYDERFLPLAARVPAMPFVQLVGSVDHGRLGVELAYAGLVASVLVSCRL